MTLVAAKLTEDLPREWIGKQALCLLFMYYSSVEASWFDIWVFVFFFPLLNWKCTLTIVYNGFSVHSHSHIFLWHVNCCLWI